MGRRSLGVDLRHTNKMQRIEAAGLKNTHTCAHDFVISSNLWVEADWDTEMHWCWRERKLSSHMDFYKARTVKRWDSVGMEGIKWEKRWRRIKPIRERQRSRKIQSKVGEEKHAELYQKNQRSTTAPPPPSPLTLSNLSYTSTPTCLAWRSDGAGAVISLSFTDREKREGERDHKQREDPDTNTHSLSLKPNN